MALDGYKDMATNRGFRMKDGAMYTYEQHKLGLSAYYDNYQTMGRGRSASSLQHEERQRTVVVATITTPTRNQTVPKKKARLHLFHRKR